MDAFCSSHMLRTGKLTGLAVIKVDFTVAPGEARFAATLVTAQSVLAGCTIATRILHTLFDVHLTGLALVGGWGGVCLVGGQKKNRCI